MERIRVPDEFRGDFQHAVICTYGANLEFFERDIWRHLTSISNCVVLADDRQLAAAWGNPEGVDARHVNISYVTTPIRNPGAAHAKLILLTSPTQGRLLVGSGNLSLDGYASQGEQFCRYEVTPEDRSALKAFHAAKAFLEGLVSRGYVDSIAARHIEQAWVGAPWIYAAAPDGPDPVRHNLDLPLIDQLVEEVGDDPVDELVVFAPFYDESASALRQLIERLQPARVQVLVQRNETSVAPAALRGVLAHHGAARVRSVEAERPGTYLHAKFVLVNQRERVVCLAGSPNLSIAALCRADRIGNLEVANLHSGDPRSFAHVLAALEMGDDLDPEQAGLEFRRSTVTAIPLASILLAVLADDVLTVEMSSPVEAGVSPVLLIAGSEVVGAELLEIDGARVKFRLTVLLRGAVPISVQLRVGTDVVETTYVYPYHAANLSRLLAGRRNPEILRRTSDLDLRDDEIEQLLDELNQVLLVNAESVWRVAGKEPQVEGSQSGGDAPSLRWDELDWENLRRHPRLAQYMTTKSSDRSLEPTDLQVILTSITEHFRRREPSTRHDVEALLVDLQDDLSAETAAQSEEEREEQEAANERRRLSIETRNRMALRRFAARCIEGLSDGEFLDRVGPAVALTNFIILNHLLALLVRRARLDLESGVSYQLDLWSLVWGDGGKGGYIAGLDREERDLALAQVDEHGADVMTFAGLLWAAIASQELTDRTRRRLRDAARYLAVVPELDLLGARLAEAALAEIGSDLPPQIDPGHALLRLAEETSEAELLDALAMTAAPDARAHVDRAVVMRDGRQERVQLVVLEAEVDFDADLARRALEEWVKLEPALTYYRIDHPASRSVVVLDRDSGDCWWARKGQGDLIELVEVEHHVEPWRAALMDSVISDERSASSA